MMKDGVPPKADSPQSREITYQIGRKSGTIRRKEAASEAANTAEDTQSSKHSRLWFLWKEAPLLGQRSLMYMLWALPILLFAAFVWLTALLASQPY